MTELTVRARVAQEQQKGSNMPSDYIYTLMDHLWQSDDQSTSTRMYALLDAARSDQIYPKILKSEMENSCLFRGEKAQELAWVAPYLVELKREDPSFRWLLENGWGKSWGIFVESLATFNNLKQHFQSFLTVYDEEGKSLLFRYYDPRVLRVYLPTCNSDEINTVFGPVSSYVLEDEDASVLLQFSGINGELQVKQRKLEES
jgi:hypothetical protein